MRVIDPMVDFAVPDDVRMICNALDEFMEREVRPLEKKLGDKVKDERKLIGPDGFLDPDVLEAVKQIRKRSAQAGYYAMHMPEEDGGAGVSKVGTFLAWKTLMKHGLGMNMEVLSFVEGPSPLFQHMTDEQKAKWLHPLVKAEVSSAFALTEPGAGSDVGAIAMTAMKDGDEYVLNGTKSYVTWGPYADFVQVFAKTDPDAGLNGISCFIVEKGTPGFTRGKPQETLLTDGAQCELVFEDCRVPAGNLIGAEGMGFLLAIGNIGDTRVTIGGQCVGLAEYLIGKMVEYANQRTAFGRPIGKQGQIQNYIAESEVERYAMENMMLNCCWRIDQGMDVMKESSIVKYYCTEALFRIADRAIQVHGGVGLMKEMPLERIFRFARLLRIPEGTSEVQKWTVAKALGL